jgi:Ca-activated chloride channel family protein
MSSGIPSRPNMVVQPFLFARRADSIIYGLFLVLLTAWGSSGPPSAAAPQFTSGVNVVEVYAAVTDAQGNPVTGLRREDFTVLEDGRAQEVSAFAEGNFPLSVAIAVDRSFSMAPKNPGSRPDFVASVAAARTFLGELKPEDQSMIVGIGSEVEMLAPLSTDRAEQQRVLSTVKPWGTTGLHDAIIASVAAIQAANGRRALVLLSDGNDRYSKASATDALDRARRSDVMVYPVAIGRDRPALFAELASLTGGRSFQPRDAAQLNTTMRTIANELRHQYLLGYTPSRPIVAGDEQWRAIGVRVTRSDVTVRARDGYLAK